MRMLWQIVYQLLRLYIVVGLLAFTFFMWHGYHDYRYPLSLFQTYVSAQLRITLGHENDALEWVSPTGVVHNILPQDFVNNPWVNQKLNALETEVSKNAFMATNIGEVACLLVV